MRFAITGTDKYLGVFEAFIRAGWQPVKLFTVPVDDLGRESNRGVIACAEEHGANVQISQMTDFDLKDLQARACDALIVASYKWRIGDWHPYLKYAVNFHPSPLPDGRGPYPAIQALLEDRKSWAVTCHKISEKFDRGDILATQYFPLSHDECHESLDIKIQFSARRLAATVAQKLPTLWDAAKPQGPGNYWPRLKIRDAIIDLKRPVEDIMRQVRAFGLNETLICVNNRWLSLRRAVGWTESYGPPPGTVVHINNRTIVMAAANGYIGLIEWSFTNDETLAELAKQ
jgi:methionyl-tRNA formyltransferase